MIRGMGRPLVVLAFFGLAPFLGGAQTFERLFAFSSAAAPDGELIQASDGAFYGTCRGGGSFSSGKVFKLILPSSVVTFASFANTNGSSPRAGLVQTTDGNLYGTTDGGGTYPNGAPTPYGAVVRLTTNGVLTALFSFNANLDNNGLYPDCQLIQATDGYLYGTTFNGGSAAQQGSVFRISTNGNYTKLYAFAGPDGADPYAGLIQARDGNLYGTASSGGVKSGGGTSSRGTVFRMTTNGALTTLLSFNGTNGSNPYSGLFEGNDGRLYGTTYYGGAQSSGTVFAITTNGILTTLYSFTSNFSGAFPNGQLPFGRVIQANDGSFYGTTSAGGAYSSGTVFRLTTNGVLTTLISFVSTNGTTPRAGLVKGSDGNLYGTTLGGGTGNGTIFRIVMPGPPLLKSERIGNELRLSWPTNADGFHLQTTTNLTTPAIWSDSLDTPATSGAEFVVTNTPTEDELFYRLKK